MADERINEIKQRFTEIDRERKRPMAAFAVGKMTDADLAKLTALEAEARNLRAELAELEERQHERNRNYDQTC